MSRESNDFYENGRLIAGYDYINQAWVIDGRYVTCGHPDTMTCDCYGRTHLGETTEPGRLDGSEPARTACRELLTSFDRIETEKERAFNWEDIDKATAAVKKDMIEKEGQDLTEKERTHHAELIDKARAFTSYLMERGDQLSGTLDSMVRLISKPGNDTQANRERRLILKARIDELDRAIEETEKARTPDTVTNYDGELLGQ